MLANEHVQGWWLFAAFGIVFEFLFLLSEKLVLVARGAVGRNTYRPYIHPYARMYTEVLALGTLHIHSQYSHSSYLRYSSRCFGSS